MSVSEQGVDSAPTLEVSRRVMNARAISMFALCSLAAACSSESNDASTDTGVTQRDAAEPDGGAEDAAAADADPPDLGPVDSGPPVLPRIVAFAANPASIAIGQTSQLVWNVQNVTELSIVASPGGVLVENSTVARGMLTTPPLDTTTSFTLTATNTFGSDSRQIFVGVDPGIPEIVSYSATPNPVQVNRRTTLTWVTRNAMRVRILSGPTVLYDTQTMVASGMFETAPLTEMENTFTLEASNFARMTTRLLLVLTQP